MDVDRSTFCQHEQQYRTNLVTSHDMLDHLTVLFLLKHVWLMHFIVRPLKCALLKEPSIASRSHIPVVAIQDEPSRVK